MKAEIDVLLGGSQVVDVIVFTTVKAAKEFYKNLPEAEKAGGTSDYTFDLRKNTNTKP